jgi:hypothetical protein
MCGILIFYDSLSKNLIEEISDFVESLKVLGIYKGSSPEIELKSNQI